MTLSQVNDEVMYQLAIGNNPELAAVHRMTGSLDDILHARDNDTTIQSWQKYYRRSLANFRDGLTSETDYETKHFAVAETLDNFVDVNSESVAINSACGLTLVDTEEFESKQDACSSLEGCTGWWRFTQIGYNQTRTFRPCCSGFGTAMPHVQSIARFGHGITSCSSNNRKATLVSCHEFHDVVTRDC